jgi:hypothetical protein
MTIYLVKGYIDVAATSLADAQSLLTALADQTDSDNLATIDRILAKLETLVQSDTGEPLTISSVDDTTGTISPWVTDAGATLAVGLGDTDPNQGFTYASTTSFSIGATTRTGTLALNTTALASALAGGISARALLGRGRPGGGHASQFTLHIRKTASGVTDTVGLLSVRVRPGVISQTTQAEVITPSLAAGAVIPLPSITSLTGGGTTALDGLTTGASATPSLLTGTTVILSYGRVGQTWQLIVGTDAESPSAGVVRPDDYNASTNARIWVQLN